MVIDETGTIKEGAPVKVKKRPGRPPNKLKKE